jgi:HTH-type transcriptional regulator, transcriptional repressor of NAD biosynthesis genes
MAAREFTHGLVLGKFYPLHAGHSSLIRAASRRCSRVTVQVLASSVESIPLQERAQWVREEHPEVNVVAAMDEADIDFNSDAAWDEHMAIISSLLDAPVDAVFTSDPYGAELASRLHARWEQIDPGRMSIPVSGNAIRADVSGHWWALGGGARSWFTRRIVVIGAESTGTTTLARKLAEHYGTLWVPEFGREWSQIRPGGLRAPWQSVEFDLVAREQARLEDAAARVVPRPLLICDTDVLATSVWHERYVGERLSSVEEMAKSRVPDLYLLTNCDIPFVQDGLRDGEHVRESMTARFRQVLNAQPAPWVEVRGSRELRLESAVAAVDQVVARGWDLADPLY